MYIKKRIKYLFIIIIVFIILKIISQELFDDRLFKFEQYKTSEQLEEIIKAKYPIGSDLNVALNNFQESGAKCYTREVNDSNKNFHILSTCEYDTNFLSLHPLENYRIWIFSDKDGKVLKIGAQRVSGLILITW
jgi:hypothetical protein